MKTQLLTMTFLALLVISSLTACSSNAARITPGHLEVSEKVNTHSAKITNIVQLSEQEAPTGKVILGSLAGALAGAVLTNGKNDTIQDIAAGIGGEVGKEAVIDKYGKTIYRLTLQLKDGSAKQVNVKGGSYIVGRNVRITVNKKSGNITSLLTS